MRLRVRLAAVLSVTALSSVGAAALPAVTAHDVASAAACQSEHNSVRIALSESKHPETTDHLSDAIAAGQPSLLHIDRGRGRPPLRRWPTTRRVRIWTATSIRRP